MSLQGRLSTKSNVWSFGITVWELLTLCRQRPFALLTGKKNQFSLVELALDSLFFFADIEVLQNAEHAYYSEGLQVSNRPNDYYAEYVERHLLFRWNCPSRSTAKETSGNCWKNAGIVTRTTGLPSLKLACF